MTDKRAQLWCFSVVTAMLWAVAGALFVAMAIPPARDGIEAFDRRVYDLVYPVSFDVGTDALNKYLGTEVTVAVVDSGVDRDHPALAGAVVHEACFVDGTCPDGPTLTAETFEVRVRGDGIEVRLP